MRGLDARIHVLLCYAKNVDGRVRPGHDDSFRFAHLRSRYQPVEHRPDQRGCRLFYCHACILHCGKNVVSRFSSAHAIWEQVCAVPSYLRGGHKEANMPVLLLVGIPVVLVGGGFVIYRIIGG
jgi:hypothetical protein